MFFFVVLPANVAFNKPAFMSSRLAAPGERAPLACAAVNGRPDASALRTSNTLPNCVHSAEDDYAAWWLVDLKRPHTVVSVSIHASNSTDNPTSKSVLTPTKFF